jgi:hypothetical protein
VRTHDTGAEAAIRYQRASSLANAPDPDWAAITEDLDRAIEIFARIGARPRLARALADYAGILETMGRPDDAAEKLARSRALAKEMGIREPQNSATVASEAFPLGGIESGPGAGARSQRSPGSPV